MARKVILSISLTYQLINDLEIWAKENKYSVSKSIEILLSSALQHTPEKIEINNCEVLETQIIQTSTKLKLLKDKKEELEKERTEKLKKEGLPEDIDDPEIIEGLRRQKEFLESRM